ARTNAVKLGFQNVEFQEADIEDLPLADNSIDKVISNCVLNLVPDKIKAYAQIFRVLRPGGGFCISDIVTVGELPDTLRNSIEAYTGCIAGAMQQDEYLHTISSSGFDAVKIVRSRQIPLPENSGKSQMTKHQLAMLRSEKNGAYSITVTGRKPEVPGK
ncbi:MAG TPA: methyltransferase domain-containing protein, partial [bacterium]|nr:methyltransferase domain-containing protein [bacterium]